ncbi:MAG TPA: hypothetical protein VME43_29280 [Bryobacteraceae bacterium]|nr:hypothetical protein [Bryobacteraceae bacterium]
MNPKAVLWLFATLPFTGSGAWAAGQKVAVRFQTMVAGEKLACGRTDSGIGATASKLSPRKFARLDFSSTGMPRGYAIHLGSTGCAPEQGKTAPPAQCGAPNSPEIELASVRRQGAGAAAARESGQR